MNKVKALEKLRERAESLKALTNSVSESGDPEFKKWRRDTEVALERIFGQDTRHIRDFKGISFTPSAFSMDNPDPAFARALRSGMASTEALLRSMAEEIEEYWDEAGDAVCEISTVTTKESNRVFVVHGHNEAVREITARLLEKLGLEPVILHEQPNRGRTIIEKFIDYADVAFAIVLLTSDDVGGKSAEILQPRARQNVLLELGFFLGRIGRDRVAALYEEGVEVPSDYDGVLFVPLDSAGGWRFLLARELKAAGLAVDFNRIA